MTTAVENRDMLEFASLYREKLDLQERMNDINKRLEEQQDALLNYFAEMGWEAPPKVLAAHPDTDAYNLLDDALEALLPTGTPNAELVLRIMHAVEPKKITLYIERKLWANKKSESEAEQACDALRENGYEHLVKPTFNVQTLSAVARELEEKGETFPAAVLAHIAVTTNVNIRGRRA